jgi:uncharacterized glyoxalase superfamily protein PhnB
MQIGMEWGAYAGSPPPSLAGMTDIFPVIRYRDAHAGIDFLVNAFGFEKHAVYEDDGVVQHAELRYGDGIVMVGQREQVDPTAVYIAVDDPDAHYQRAKAAGATIERELSDEDYGSREYSAKDPEGHQWSFGTYRPS